MDLQSVVEEIILAHGENDYKIPHFNKDRWWREGEYNTCLLLSPRSLELAREYMSYREEGETSSIGETSSVGEASSSSEDAEEF